MASAECSDLSEPQFTSWEQVLRPTHPYAAAWKESPREVPPPGAAWPGVCALFPALVLLCNSSSSSRVTGGLSPQPGLERLCIFVWAAKQPPREPLNKESS